MANEWSLDALYSGYESAAYVNDFKKLEESFQTLEQLDLKDDLETIKKVVSLYEDITVLVYKLGSFSSLQLAVNTTDEASLTHQAKLEKLLSQYAKTESRASKFLGTFKTDVSQDEKLKAYSFYFHEKQVSAQRLLSDDVEEVIATMNLSAGKAWEQLRDFLTSTMTTEFQGKTLTMSDIRNLAYDKDPAVRKAAYEAELAMYQPVKESVAFSLNNIKSQVNDISRLRGYSSALEATLERSRMSQATLDALLSAIQDSLPAFRKYFKQKAKLLGHSKGLPFYDLFAPVGQAGSQTFTYEESQTFLLDLFNQFSPDLADLAKEAFDNNYIDVYPRPGKVGGAFCANLPMIKQSRVMLNFDGSLSSVVTTAHELGHAYHGSIIENHLPLNWDYSMPVAETASTFNEAIVKKNLLAKASDQEKIGLLEAEISDTAQIIVDIYSRYLFEKSVFEARHNQFLFSKDLEKLMVDAQLEAYGDGLDPDYLHPFMWICKPHYYSSGLSYYNFPYAFGGLFSLGLYATYQEEPEGFVEKYKNMLYATTITSVEGTGQTMGIDLTQKAFWQKALAQVEAQIDAFIALTNK